MLQDHQEKKAWLVTSKVLRTAYNFLEIETLCPSLGQKPRFHDLKRNLQATINPLRINNFESNLKVGVYRSAFDKIQNRIDVGD
jgi:hypothetical protein